MSILADILSATILFMIPLLLVALGGMFSERSGVVNIALEGQMLIAAFTGVAASAYAPQWIPGLPGWTGLLALLLSRRLSALSLRRGTNWFLAEMLLFFVPAVLAVLGHREFFGLIGLKILAVILVSTISVMVSTALAVEACYRRMSRHA